MKFVLRAVEIVAKALHLPNPATVGVQRTATAAAAWALAAGAAWVSAHAVDLHLSPIEIGVVGVALQGLSKWRRTTNA